MSQIAMQLAGISMNTLSSDIEAKIHTWRHDLESNRRAIIQDVMDGRKKRKDISSVVDEMLSRDE